MQKFSFYFLFYTLGFLCGLALIPFIDYRETPQLAAVSQVERYPKLHHLIERDGYTLYYDQRLKNASWVYEQLSLKNLKGIAKRKNFHFKEDDVIAKPFRASLEDYRHSGFDRGHLVPAANHKVSDRAMGDTFYLSNISPQNALLNRGYWAKLEQSIRTLTQVYPVVHVFTGPLFIPSLAADGKKYVHYQVIGQNEVAVPTHFFKVIHCQSKQGFKSQAFIVPNQNIPLDAPLDQFATTVEKVERLAGALLAPPLFP